MGGFLRGFILGIVLAAAIFIGLSAVFPIGDGEVATSAAPTVVPAPSFSAPDPEPGPAAEPAISETPASALPPDIGGGDQGPGIEIAAPSFGNSGAQPGADALSAPGIGGGDEAPTRPGVTSQVAVEDIPRDGTPAVDTESATVPEVSTSIQATDAEGRVPLTGAPLIAGNALVENAVPFTGSPDRPRMAIILLDTGASDTLRQGLLSLSAPITFGVAANLENASEIARSYHAAGYEIVAALPETGQVIRRGDDVGAFRDLLSGSLAAVPVATAVVDRVGGPLALDPDLAQGALESLGTTGHALLTHRGVGLNRVSGQAADAGVPSDVVFSVIDDGVSDIAAELDRAVAEAGQRGQVIVLGHVRTETVTVLFPWLLGRAAAEVSIAPVSALIAE